MKILCIKFVFLFSCISFVPYVHATDTSGYWSLKYFCMTEEKDTREHCECGQATANKIMSPKEKAMALALMKGDRKVVS